MLNPQIIHELAKGESSAVEDVGGGAGEAVGGVGQGAGQASRQAGEAAQQAGEVAQDVGGTASQATEQGDGRQQGASEKAPAATQAARRLAEKLGVDLSQIEGCG